MDSNTALVLGILAQLSADGSTKYTPAAPSDLYISTRETYQNTEDKLKDVKVSVHVSKRGLQKALVWQPGMGLCIPDRGGSGLPHWTSVPDTILVEALTLLPTLMDEAHITKTKIGATALFRGAQGVMEGVSVPLVPLPSSKAKPLTIEDKPQAHAPGDTGEQTDEEEDFWDYEEDEEEETPELEPGFIDKTSKEEVVGLDLLINDPPPAVIIADLPTKKRGKK